ncbi:MAG: hypothetical protein ACRD1P_14195, partial [Thermoanaerobaculia bacterium]
RLRGRVVVVIYLLLGGVGSLWGSYALMREVHHWAAWAFALLVLEPVAAASLLCIGVLLVPESFFAEFLAGALRRAKFIAIAFLVAYIALIVGLLSFAGWELWKVR